jgi:hypothetical protein
MSSIFIKKKEETVRMIEVGPEEMWTDFHEQINNMLIEEKRLRHNNDHANLAEVCCNIVSPQSTKTWLSSELPSIARNTRGSGSGSFCFASAVGKPKSQPLT